MRVRQEARRRASGDAAGGAQPRGPTAAAAGACSSAAAGPAAGAEQDTTGAGDVPKQQHAEPEAEAALEASWGEQDERLLNSLLDSVRAA